jgi:hypothetical protein
MSKKENKSIFVCRTNMALFAIHKQIKTPGLELDPKSWARGVCEL